MMYEEGDPVLIVAGDFEGNFGIVERYEDVFDRYLVQTGDITIAARDWELTAMPEYVEEDDATYKFKVTVITPDSFNEFITEAVDAVSIVDGMLEVVVAENGMQTAMKAYAPGAWLTVDVKLLEVTV